MAVHREIASFESEISMALEVDRIFNMESKRPAEGRPRSGRFVKYLNMGSTAAKWVVARLRVIAAQVFIYDPCEDLNMAHARINLGSSDRRGL